MNLALHTQLAKNYSSGSQKIRVMTEDWVNKMVFCPNCGHLDIDRYPNNQPVADFFCSNCSEDYELKSKSKAIGIKIVDGAYATMIHRLTSQSNPNFFFLTYDLAGLQVSNFIVIPKHFFVPEIIEKRTPLAPTARRAGWIGCNILLQSIPQSGKIFYVRNGETLDKNNVLSQWQRTLFLREENELLAKGWLLDIMRCIDKLGKRSFTLADIYSFESHLQALHPSNRHVKEKVRQQLQLLRDKGYIEFTSRGHYKVA